MAGFDPVGSAVVLSVGGGYTDPPGTFTIAQATVTWTGFTTPSSIADALQAAKVEVGAWLSNPPGASFSKVETGVWLHAIPEEQVSKVETGVWLTGGLRRGIGKIFTINFE